MQKLQFFQLANSEIFPQQLEELGFFGAATVRRQRWRELAGVKDGESKREESEIGPGWASLELARLNGDGEMELENGDKRTDWSVVTGGGGGRRQSKREKRMREKRGVRR